MSSSHDWKKCHALSIVYKVRVTNLNCVPWCMKIHQNLALLWEKNNFLELGHRLQPLWHLGHVPKMSCWPRASTALYIKHVSHIRTWTYGRSYKQMLTQLAHVTNNIYRHHCHGKLHSQWLFWQTDEIIANNIS